MTSAPARDLVSVLEAILRDEHCELDADELSVKESQKVRRMIREILEISDSPSSRDPFQIADFVYWNCEGASRVATERYLAALTDKQVSRFGLTDILGLLAPGLYNDIDGLAREAENGED